MAIHNEDLWNRFYATTIARRRPDQLQDIQFGDCMTFLYDVDADTRNKTLTEEDRAPLFILLPIRHGSDFFGINIFAIPERRRRRATVERYIDIMKNNQGEEQLKLLLKFARELKNGVLKEYIRYYSRKRDYLKSRPKKITIEELEELNKRTI